MERIAVRRLTPDDFAEYREIRLAALTGAPEAFGSTFEAEAARPDAYFVERLTTSIVVGAFAGSAIVGMAGLRREEGQKRRHKAFLWGVYVAVGARRLGAGAAMIEAILAMADDMVEQVTLTVVASNVGAVRLYSQFDFETYGREPRALKSASGYEDQLLMVRFARTPRAAG